MQAVGEDDFGGIQPSDSRFVGRIGGSWGAVPMTTGAGDKSPFVPPTGPGAGGGVGGGRRGGGRRGGGTIGIGLGPVGLGRPSRPMDDENDDTSEGPSVDDDDPETDEEGDDDPETDEEGDDDPEVVDEGDDDPVPPYVPDDGEPPQPVGVSVGINTDPPPALLEAEVAEPVDERQFASVGVNTDNTEGDDDPVPPYVPDDGEPPQPVGVTVGTDKDPPPDPLEAEVAEPVDERQIASVGVNTSNRPRAPTRANVSVEVDRYLQDLLSSVDKDTREADELLGQLARPPSVHEEKEEPVPVLDPVAAGVMKAVARGDHASAAALLQDKQAEDDRKKQEEEAKKNQMYRYGVRNKIPLRGAKGPLNPNAKGVEVVAPPAPEQGWNRPAPARRVSNSVAGIVAAPTFRDIARDVDEAAESLRKTLSNPDAQIPEVPPDNKTKIGTQIRRATKKLEKMIEKPDEQAGPSRLLPPVPINSKVANLIKTVEDRERRINRPDIQPRGRSEQPPRRAGLGPGAHAQPPRPLGHYAEPLHRNTIAPPQVSSAKPRSRVITRQLPKPNNVNKNAGRFL